MLEVLGLSKKLSSSWQTLYGTTRTCTRGSRDHDVVVAFDQEVEEVRVADLQPWWGKCSPHGREMHAVEVQ